MQCERVLPFSFFFSFSFLRALPRIWSLTTAIHWHFILVPVLPFHTAMQQCFHLRSATSPAAPTVCADGLYVIWGSSEFPEQPCAVFNAGIQLDVSRLVHEVIIAGNIWTIRDYKDQPGGQFKFDKFYKQIAVAYGLGLRLDLDFFVLRFDGGMKAINPAYEKKKDRYPIIHPKFSRDFAFHFAVGYPF